MQAKEPRPDAGNLSTNDRADLNQVKIGHKHRPGNGHTGIMPGAKAEGNDAGEAASIGNTGS